MTLQTAAELAERHELVVADRTGGLEHRVNERRRMTLENIKWSFAGLSGCPKSYRKCPASKTAMRSAAESVDVGCPEPAAVEHRMLSMRSCRARSRYSSIFVSVWAAVATF